MSSELYDEFFRYISATTTTTPTTTIVSTSTTTTNVPSSLSLMIPPSGQYFLFSDPEYDEYYLTLPYHSAMNRINSTITIVPTSTSNVPSSTSNMRTSSLMTQTTTINEQARVTVSSSTLTRRVRTSTSTPEMTSTRNVRASMSTRGTSPVSLSTRNVRTSLRHVYEVFGRPPASSSAVAMLPRVSVVEKGVCVICLEEWLKDDIVTELPCEHKYHSECVEKWLGIHATCPQCRYEIPLEDDEVSVDSDEHSSDYEFDLMSQTNDLY